MSHRNSVPGYDNLGDDLIKLGGGKADVHGIGYTSGKDEDGGEKQADSIIYGIKRDMHDVGALPDDVDGKPPPLSEGGMDHAVGRPPLPSTDHKGSDAVSAFDSRPVASGQGDGYQPTVGEGAVEGAVDQPMPRKTKSVLFSRSKVHPVSADEFDGIPSPMAGKKHDSKGSDGSLDGNGGEGHGVTMPRKTSSSSAGGGDDAPYHDMKTSRSKGVSLSGGVTSRPPEHSASGKTFFPPMEDMLQGRSLLMFSTANPFRVLMMKVGSYLQSEGKCCLMVQQAAQFVCQCPSESTSLSVNIPLCEFPSVNLTLSHSV